MRKKSKFYLIWGILLGLAILSACLDYLQTFGFADLNAFAEFIMPGIVGFGIASILLIYIKSPTNLSPRKVSRGIWGSICSRKAIGARRCYKCKRILEDSTGARCQLCRWIRCQCGACNCGRGALI